MKICYDQGCNGIGVVIATKKPKKYDSPLTEGPEQEEDEVMTALNMSEEVAAKVQKILQKLGKLDTIELSLKNIETKLAKLETRTTELEAFKEETKKDISKLKDGANFASKQLQEKCQELAKAEAEITELTRKVQKHEEAVKETESKCLYLEAYSRRENIKFMNIEEGPPDQPEDTEEILRDFLGRELGYVDAQNVEFQRVHRTGKTKEGSPRPILARFLRYKDVQNIFSLGHRLKGSKFQMFRDQTYRLKLLNAARYRWKLLRLLNKEEYQRLLAKHNQISCILEGAYGL